MNPLLAPIYMLYLALLPILNSQPAPSGGASGNKKGGTMRAWLWLLAFIALFGFLGYFGMLGLSAILSYASGGNFIVSKVLHDFGYYNASQAVNAIALTQLYQSQSLPYVGAILGAVFGGIIGYFKGKQEDKEEQ